MNPELQRNLWTRATPRRLAFAGAVLAGVFVAVWLVDRGRHAYAVTFAGAAVFFVAALLWAPRSARRSVTDEVRGGTWDAQRLCALQPLAMTWGKLAGATAASWAFAAGGLGLATLQLASTSTLAHALTWMIAALGLAAALQACGLASGLLDVRRARAEGRPPSLRAPGLALVVLGVLTLALLVWARTRFDAAAAQWPGAGTLLGRAAQVEWYGRAYAPARFAAASLFVMALWAAMMAWRLMRLELLYPTGTWPWIVFVLFAGLYALGFAPPAAAADPLATRLATATGAFTGLAYLAAFAEPADRVQGRRTLAALARGDVGEALRRPPMLLAPFAAALAGCALGVVVRLRAGEGALAVALLAAFAALARDLGLIVWIRFRRRGGDAAPVLLLLALYAVAALASWLAPHGRLVALLLASAARPRLSLVALGLEAALAWTLAAAAIRRPAAPPFRLTPVEPREVEPSPPSPPATAVPTTPEPDTGEAEALQAG